MDKTPEKQEEEETVSVSQPTSQSFEDYLKEVREEIKALDPSTRMNLEGRFKVS